MDNKLDNLIRSCISDPHDRTIAEVKQAIKQLIDEAYKKGYIDGAIAEAKSLTDFLKKRGNK